MERLDRRVIVAVILGILLITFWGGTKYEGWRSDQSADSVQVIADDSGQEVKLPAEDMQPEKEAIYVHVTGAVERSGVYELQQGDRVEDALALAGISADADIDALNRAAPLSDGQKLLVPTIVETANGEISAQSTTISAIAADGQVSINQASQQELMTLPGIGEVKAQAIIDYRTANGGFKSLEELKNVKGIGDKTYQGLMDKITL